MERFVAFLAKGLGATSRSRAVHGPLPRLLLRQAACGVGLEVCESVSGARYRVTCVQPQAGGIQARVFVTKPDDEPKDPSKTTELSAEILWGGRWSILSP